MQTDLKIFTLDTGWKTPTSNTAFVLTPRVLSQCQADVIAATSAYTPEQTAASQYGPTSLIVRVDATLVDPAGGELVVSASADATFPEVDGLVRSYEVDGRPAGLGIACLLSDDFTKAFARVRQGWQSSPIRVVLSPHALARDDHIWAGSENVIVGSKVPDDGSLLLVRARSHERAFLPLASRSISLVATEYDKSYGERVKPAWWKWVTSVDQLPETGTFVLKPRATGGAKHILICRPSAHGGKPGMYSRTKLLHRFNEIASDEGGMYLQPYFPPLRFDNKFLILRIFYAFDVPTHQWICLGGFWNLRANVVVHGGGETIFGPLALC